jgi:hypothetical protein
MWTLILERLAELALALLSAVKSVAAAVLQWQAAQLGEVKGRAESEAEHAEAARRASDEMLEIAGRPATRDEILKRLEEGSA